jgi:homoserine/homoserine lactone efflux protein
LGALIAASSTAFLVIKWLGVAYLVWLGVKQFRAPAVPLVADAGPDGAQHATRRALLFKGWAINSLNPKGTAFMLAVVPQFLNPTAPLVPQYAVVAATLAFTDLVVMAGYTALASRVLRAFKTPRQMTWLNRVFGSLFIAAGVWLATFKRAG